MSTACADALTRAIGVRVFDDPTPVGGGSISEAWRYRTERGAVFVKCGHRSAAALFQAEAAGLRELAAAHAVRVPEVLALGEYDDRVFLCLEWLDLVPATQTSHSRLGEQLAALHAQTSTVHGWLVDNFIGSTAQRNEPHTDWLTFFCDRRLHDQLSLAEHNGADQRTLERGRRLCESLPALFADYRPVPSLLHGDLWGGNSGSLGEHTPVIFDPAVYYGDREADIAMTRLFGGFGPEFYASYESTWPLDVNAAQRVPLYNLYHVLNHFNLFGGAYLSQARSMIDRLLAAIGR